MANTIKLLAYQEKEHLNKKTDKEKSNEDFLKFVSDSRDWAYIYIENVQESLNKFVKDVDPEIDYFNEYGIAGSSFPHYNSIKKISESYKELKKLLPIDYDKTQ